jgi:hypothetical protein
MEFLIHFRHVHPNEIDSLSVGTIFDDLSRAVHAGSVDDSSGVDPSLRQYTDEMAFPFSSKQ